MTHRILLSGLFTALLYSAFAQAVTTPIIGFRVTVEKLRLRADADKNAAVLAELPEHTQLVYLNQTKGNWDEVTLRNRPHKARWYKVHPADNPKQIGWVYGGAVALSSVYIPTDSNATVPILKYDFLELKTITSQQYQAVANSYKNPVIHDTLAYKTNDSTFVLPIQDGTQTTFVSRGTEENTETYWYVGHWPDIHQYIVRGSYYEYEDAFIIDQRTGRQVQTEGFPYDIPLLSPDKQWLATDWADPYEFIGGLQWFAVLPDGVYPAALLTIEGVYFDGLCWDSQGNLYFKSYNSDSEVKVLRYHQLVLPKTTP